MVSTNKKFALNKEHLIENLFPLHGMKHFMKNPFPQAVKTASIVRNWKKGKK